MFAISKREIRASLTEKVTLKEKAQRRGGEAQHEVICVRKQQSQRPYSRNVSGVCEELQG